MRQRGDTAFCELLCRVRTATCTSDDLSVLKSREIAAGSSNYPNHALHVYRLNTDVDTRNILMLNALAPESAQYSIQACDAVAGQTYHVELTTLSEKRTDTGGLHSLLKLAIGARIMLTTNVDVSDGLVNGARGEVVHIAVNSENNVTHILINFDNPEVGAKAKHATHFRNYPDAVPLTRHETLFLARGKHGSEVTRIQFPLTLAWATTIHKVQGLTLDEIVVDMKGGHFSPGQAYVAFSRVKKLKGLHILNFNPNAIKASQHVKLEMERLNNYLLNPIPVITNLLPLASHISIALLNTRSILIKLPDINQDDSLKFSHVVCFTETWLKHDQHSPNLADHQVIARKDRDIINNTKGGVLIAAHTLIQAYHIANFSFNNIPIEATTAILTTPNHKQIEVTLIYRSPSVSISTLLTVLSSILSQSTTLCVPSIILGDFNEDLLAKSDLRLPNLMSSHGYSQLVQSSTTDNGTLIDHVYYNKPSEYCTVQVMDAYYSDHDIIHCSIPMLP